MDNVELDTCEEYLSGQTNDTGKIYLNSANDSIKILNREIISL